VERLIGSIRRDCLDHIIVFNERHLKRILDYYHRRRTHLGLEMEVLSICRSLFLFIRDYHAEKRYTSFNRRTLPVPM
jgi:hypothetical protein